MANSRQPHRTRTGYLSQPWWRRWARSWRSRSSGMDASKARMAWREGESDSSSQGNSGRHRCGVMENLGEKESGEETRNLSPPHRGGGVEIEKKRRCGRNGEKIIGIRGGRQKR